MPVARPWLDPRRRQILGCGAERLMDDYNLTRPAGPPTFWGATGCFNALIINAQKLFQPSLGEHLEIEVCLDENAWPALVDPTQLTTALLNLAVNARDAMPKGGKLTLETRNVVL